MKRKILFLFLLVSALGACHKDDDTVINNDAPVNETLTKEELKAWWTAQVHNPSEKSTQSANKTFALTSLPVNWENIQSMPNTKGNYWLQDLPGQPVYQNRLKGYRKIALFKDGQNNIQARILEIVPDGIYLQRKQRVSTHDFTGRIFLYDQHYTLLGGTIVRDGKKIGEIRPAPTSDQATNQVHTNKIQVVESCQWSDSNYVDADGVAVVYSEMICSYGTVDDGFSGIPGGYDSGSGDYLGGGGGANVAVTVPEVSDLPGETGGAINPKQYMDCFSTIPDAGATMNVTVYVQEPQPGTLFNIGKNSVGHVAIGLSKSNGTQSINQVVGFYPDATGFDKMHAPSKIVDNGAGSYDVSITYSVNYTQFKQIQDYISNPPQTYDLTNFNCTNFVNEACKSGGIILPNPYNVIGLSGPGGATTAMTSAGLGDSIENLKGQNNVNLDSGSIPFSKGPCN